MFVKSLLLVSQTCVHLSVAAASDAVHVARWAGAGVASATTKTASHAARRAATVVSGGHLGVSSEQRACRWVAHLMDLPAADEVTVAAYAAHT